MEQINPSRVADQVSYTALVKEVSITAKDIVGDELALIRAELKEVGPRATRHSLEAVVFSSLAAVGVLPFVAFLVIGLGNILEGRYWLSSLIVAGAFFAIGVPLALRAIRCLKELDLSFPKSRQGFKRSVEAVSKTAKAVQDAAEGDENESVIRH